LWAEATRHAVAAEEQGISILSLIFSTQEKMGILQREVGMSTRMGL
jgi:hypothetical protein